MLILGFGLLHVKEVILFTCFLYKWLDFNRNGTEAWDFNERTGDKIVEFMKE